MPSQVDLTAQWIIAQEQIVQAEARLADLRAHRESVEGELHKLLGGGWVPGILCWLAARGRNRTARREERRQDNADHATLRTVSCGLL